MAKAKHTYAVRLAVEGGNRVKADLVSVGTSGERSIKKIDRASDKASRGLSTLGDRASSLRSRMRLLGGVIAGIAAGGGIAFLINRSIAAADSIGKLADAIGVSTDTLQELRYAAGLAGISTEQLDGALVAFSKRVGEARSGTGTLITLLQRMDPALLANVQAARTVDEAFEIVMRRAASLGSTLDRNALLAAAFGRTAGPLMANLIDDGIESLEALRERARDLGIVLDEALIRNAERAKDEMDTLGTVISANVTRAVLGLAPALADVSTWLADIAVDAGDAYEKLKLIAQGDFNFEGLSLGAVRREVEERKQELIEIARELNALPPDEDPGFFEGAWESLFGTERENLTEELQEKVAIYRQWAAKLAWMQAEAERRRAARAGADRTPAGDGDTPADGTTEDEKAAQERARRLVRIEESLNRQLFQQRHEGAERIRAEHEKLVTELQHLIKPDGSNLDEVERLLIGAAAVRDDKLAELARREQETADRRAAANQRILEGLRAEQEALAMTDRQRFVSQAVRRLSAEATEEQRRQVEALAGALFDERQAEEARDRARESVAELEAERAALAQTDRQRFISLALRRLSTDATAAQRAQVRELAGALYDEQQAIEARNEAEREANRLRAEGEALTRRLRTAEEAYADEIERLRVLLDAGAITQESFGRASEEAYDRMLRSSREWSDGVRRAIRDYLDDATDAATTFEQATTRALKASEDAFVEWAMTGKFSAKDLFNTIAEEALRAAYRMAVVQPLNNILGTIFGAIGGGIAGGAGAPTTGGGFGNATPPPMDFYPVGHEGLIVGQPGGGRRRMSSAIFAGARRYHRGGIVAGEVPILARAGEGVFTSAQMRSLAPVSDAKPTVHVAVNVRNTAPGTQASADVRREAGGDLTLDIVVEQVEGGMARRIGRGEGLAPTLERRYGLNPAAGSLR